MNDVKIYGIMYQFENEDDYSYWEGFQLSPEDEKTIQDIFNKYDTYGYSIRGTKQDILMDIYN